MSLAQNVIDLAQRTSTQDKLLLTLISGNVSDLSALLTTQKSNLVAALNELKTAFDNLELPDGGAVIDDTGVSTTKVWSSSKTSTEISAQITAAVSGIVNSAPGALDTLKELADALGSNPNFATDIATALGNRVRTDINNQGLNATQQQNARTNIDAAKTAHTHSTDDIVSGTMAAARLPSASESAVGIVELATNAEVATGTDTARAVTPAGLRSVMGNPETDFVAIFEAGLA